MTDQVVNQLLMPVVVGLILIVGSVVGTQLLKRRHRQAGKVRAPARLRLGPG